MNSWYMNGVNYGYFSEKKLHNGQIAMIFFIKWNSDARSDVYSIAFAIADKKKEIMRWILEKEDVFDTKMTGKSGIEGLIWAKEKIKEFEQKIINRKRPTVIEVGWLDKKRKEIYRRALGKMGFEYGIRDKEFILYKKINQPLSKKDRKRAKKQKVS